MAVIKVRNADNERVFYINPDEVSMIEDGGSRLGIGGMLNQSIVTMKNGATWNLRGDSAEIAALVNEKE